jgi:hypothetical protein
VLNAWESDFCGDPLIAIVSSLTIALGKERGEREKAKTEALRDAAKDVGNFALALAGGIAQHVSGLDVLKAGKYAEEKKASRSAKPRHDVLALFEARINSHG